MRYLNIKNTNIAVISKERTRTDKIITDSDVFMLPTSPNDVIPRVSINKKMIPYEINNFHFSLKFFMI